MILHTVLPDQAVLEGEEELEEQVKKQRMTNINGHQLVIEPVSESECRIVRLISSDPQVYLDARYQPGTILPMSPDLS